MDCRPLRSSPASRRPPLASPTEELLGELAEPPPAAIVVHDCPEAVVTCLLAHDWGGTLTLTDDFLVTAAELELSDLRTLMERTLAPERIARLADEGLLPAR